MNSTRYKILGYTVWHGGRWYLRRRYLSRLPSRRRLGAGLLLGALLGLLALILLARRG
ncbi:MAG TPA: hypothetical protein VGF15_00180 [Solirubrobacteraceae bacterium]